MLNLAGADTSPSKSDQHLAEERAGPGIHGLGRVLCPTVDGWKQTLSFSISHASLLLVMTVKGRNRHSGLAVTGGNWIPVGSRKEGSFPASGSSSSETPLLLWMNK